MAVVKQSIIIIKHHIKNRPDIQISLLPLPPKRLPFGKANKNHHRKMFASYLRKKTTKETGKSQEVNDG